MTLPYERTFAVTQTEAFLRRLCDSKVTPGLKKSIREEARALLRHYPTLTHFIQVERSWDQPLVKFISDCPFRTKP